MEQIKDKMIINIGPQHPSTHGILRLMIKLEGETVVSCTPVIGYLHRGMEKMAQNRRFIQYLSVVDRIDYLSGFFYSQGFCSAVESLLEIEVPKRASYIRILTMELNRIASHLLWLGSYMMDLGAAGPIFYTFRERNQILKLFEKLTSSRMMYNYYIFGGVRYDVDNKFLQDVKDFINTFGKKIKEYEIITEKNPVFRDRTMNIGILDTADALEYSITGVNLRASGYNFDARKDKPYLAYDKLDFKIPISDKKDCFARYKLRMDEMKISLDIIEQCLDWLLSDTSKQINLNLKSLSVKPKEDCIVSYTESPRGLVMCHLYSDGSDMPLRVKWRTPSFYAVQILKELVCGVSLQDLMSIFGSLDVVLPEVDR